MSRRYKSRHVLISRHNIDNEVRFPRTEARHHELAFATAFVFVATITDNGRSPHLGLQSGHPAKELEKGFGISAPGFMINGSAEIDRVDLTRFGFQFGFHQVLFC